MDDATPFFDDPTSITALLIAIVGIIFWLSGKKSFEKLFRYTPPVIYIYFVPMFATTFGLTPVASPAYDWLTRYLLPFALLLLMISVDLKSVAKLGSTALIMIVTGTVGVIIGAPISLMLFKDALPPEAWTGFAALSGSWIGGTANMVAVAESVGTPESVFGPIIVVDTVVGYGWMGILLLFSGYQKLYDKSTNARTEVLEATNARLAAIEERSVPLRLPELAAILALGFAGGVLALTLGGMLDPVAIRGQTVVSSTTWAILIVVTGGLLLSFTPLRKLEESGASKVGYAGLYLLLAGIGAQADLNAVLDAPIYLLAGTVWIGIHVLLLLIVARIIRAPLFFVATGSMANIGGAASAPVVAGVYHPALAPVGLLMAVVGYVLGIYGGLLAAAVLSLVGGG